jgi:hypothetical protein
VVVDLPGGQEESWAVDDIAWIARVIWVSQ